MSEGVLYVNDMPTRRSNGGVDGGYVYDAERQHVVAVSYVRPDGRCTRVSFDPRTGEPSIQRYYGERPGRKAASWRLSA